MGLDAPRMEIARVEVDGADLRAEGTQIGVAYELRYRLEGGALDLETVGGPSARAPGRMKRTEAFAPPNAKLLERAKSIESSRASFGT